MTETYCLWGNRGIGDQVFYLPTINSIKKHNPKIKVLIPQPVWKIGSSFNKVMPSNVEYIPNLPPNHPLVKKRINASNKSEKEYYGQKIMEFLLESKSPDYFVSTRNFTNPKIDAKEIELLQNKSGLIHEVDLYGNFIKKRGIKFIKDFSFNINNNKNKQVTKVLILQESGRLNKSITEKTYKFIQKELERQKILYTKFNTQFNNIIDLINHLNNYSVIIGPDTGIIHLADSIGKSCFTLFGPTNSNRYGPYNNLKNILKSKSGKMNGFSESELTKLVGEAIKCL